MSIAIRVPAHHAAEPTGSTQKPQDTGVGIHQSEKEGRSPEGEEQDMITTPQDLLAVDLFEASPSGGNRPAKGCTPGPASEPAAAKTATAEPTAYQTAVGIKPEASPPTEPKRKHPGGRPKLKIDEIRNRNVTIRLTTAEDILIKLNAANTHLSVSDYLRTRGLGLTTRSAGEVKEKLHETLRRTVLELKKETTQFEQNAQTERVETMRSAIAILHRIGMDILGVSQNPEEENSK